MAPKKAGTPVVNGNGGLGVDGSVDGNAQSQKFTWEGPNDLKLLLLTQGRWVKPEEYEHLSRAFGDDLSTGSIRNRVSKLRVQQRTLYEELGWELPEGGATKRTANASGSGGTPTATPKKRGTGAGAGSADSLEAEQGTPTKKARGQVKVAAKPKTGGKKSVQQDLGRGDEGAEGEGAKVKEEVLDDDDNDNGQEA